MPITPIKGTWTIVMKRYAFKKLLIGFCFCLLILGGCENTDERLVIGAGIDALKAVTLTEDKVRELSLEAARHADTQNELAGPDDGYSVRLRKIVGEDLERDGISFNFKVYLSHEINAFAMADGTVRVYRGLMDMMNDDELRFVIGHEMGHVVKKHITDKVRLAYVASAARKTVASQDGMVGDLARSSLGDFSQILLLAQFSQLEEKEADDYGLQYIKNKGHDPKAAISALRKLATLGNNHSFLSSHPAPDKRAARLELQLAGKAVPIEQRKSKINQHVIGRIKEVFPPVSR